MYADDQDEDVEEEEEFHEVEEEKHKTSQDAVNDSNSNHAETTTPEKATTSPGQESSTDIDWANIMLSTQSESTERPKTDEISTSEPAQSENIDRPVREEISACHVAPSESAEPTRTDETSPSEPAQPENSDRLEANEISPSKPAQSQDSDRLETNEISSSKSAQLENSDQTVEPTEIPSSHAAQPEDSDRPVPDETSESQAAQPEGTLDPQDVVRLSDDSIMNNIIKDTQDKLKIVDESCDEIEQKKQDQEEPKDSLDQQASDLAPVAADEVVSSEKTPEEDAELASDDKKSDKVEKKELDLDEDVKNPQYIPKKGVFYEHDDRSHDLEEKKASTTTKKDEDAVDAKEINVSKRTPSQDKQAENRRSNRRQRTDGDRWNHDLFRGEKQKPKSKSELINAYGYDIRHERSGRNQQTDGRQPRSSNNSNADRPQTSQDGQRSRQSKDGRGQRQNQPNNRSRERRGGGGGGARRPNVSKVTQQQRNDGTHVTENKRDLANTRSSRSDVKDTKDLGDEKLAAPSAPAVLGATSRRDQELPSINRNPRNDSRGRRKTSRDRPSNNEERLPPANTVMPPITTWSNEDMMKAEAFGKKSPPRMQNANATIAATSNNVNAHRDRSSDLWQQSQQNKTIYQERPVRNQDESRQQGYNSRGRYQERGDENHRPAQSHLSRNHYHDRTSQSQDWNRTNNLSSYGKPNDYIVKTQTFENSRLAQANINRASNNRDLREVINERRMQGQQNFQNKVHHGIEHHTNQRGPNQGQVYHHQYAQSHLVMHQHQMGHNQQQSPQAHVMQQQQQQPLSSQHHQQSQQQTQRHIQVPTSSQQQASSQTQPQTNPQAQQTQHQNHRQQPTTTQAQSHQGASRQTTVSSTTSDGSSQDLGRVSSGTTSTDPINSRPIIKTDTYTGGMHSHQQPLSQHSQNHRSMTGPMAQQGSAPTTSHMVPSHMGAGAQPQYYTPGSRDPTASAAAVAAAYHGYIPGGHTVMDATRYHMASQQLTDHGYMTTSNQTSDVSGGPVLHQQSMYPDTSAGGAVANSAFLTQHPGSTISPNTNIPITGAGPQLPPVSYIQHSQYPPPPYPYTQPQHNQGPPQSGHAYPPYWTYI
uniref:Protein CASC3 n=1 Tax=Aceria tosichella TaxID=561515 RepID=A0A6G1SHN8_9ACAR